MWKLNLTATHPKPAKNKATTRVFPRKATSLTSLNKRLKFRENRAIKMGIGVLNNRMEIEMPIL